MNIESFKGKNTLVGCVILLCLTCFVLFAMLFHTDNLPEKYGKEFNLERKEREIPIIPDNWSFFSTSEKRIWENPIWDKTDRSYGDGGNPLIIHYHKTLVVTDKNVFKETDIYVGDILTRKVDEVVLEKIEITCIYLLGTTDIDCTTDIRTQDVVYSGEDITKAKEILDEWGIPYP